MSGNDILLDTNTCLYLLGGDKKLSGLLDNKNLFISFITEIELLGYHNLSKKDLGEIRHFIKDCTVINLNKEIKLLTIDLRSSYRIKFGDSMIAATAMHLDLPLITSDKHFGKILEVNLILYEVVKR